MRRLWIALALLASGCASPPELGEAERASIEALANYHANAEEAVAALLDAYKASGRQTVNALVELEVRDATREVVIPPAEEGAEPQTLRYVAPDAVLHAVLEYGKAMDRIEGEASGFQERWTKANTDYSNAVEIREEVYRWLTRPGIGPEEIDAAGRALADSIRRYQR